MCPKYRVQVNGDLSTIYDTTLADSEYDPDGRVVVHYEYLYTGGPIKKTSVLNESGAVVKQVTNVYGPAGEVLTETGNVQQASVTYDPLYRVKTLIDPNNQITEYTYDEVGNLTQVDLPGDETIYYPDHDPSGRALRRVDGRNWETTYVYNDAQNLLTDVHYTNRSAYDIHYTYDTAHGWCTSVTDGEGTTGYQYDDRGAATSVTTTYTGLPAKTISYNFFDNGSISSMTTPAGTFAYTYDGANRPVQLVNPFSETFSWTYQNNNWLSTQTTPVSQTAYTYNHRGFMTCLENKTTGGTTLSKFGGTVSPMTYDTFGNLLSVTVNIPSVPAQNGVTNYSYDPLDQLLQEQTTRNGGYTDVFAYDAAGNPTTFKGASRSYDGVKNQRLGYTYDGNGNPTVYRNGVTLAYDPEDRLISYGSTLMGYHDGLRAWKEDSGGNKTYFLYDGLTPVCELNEGGTVVATNTFGANGLLARREGTESVFYTFDDGGNVVQLLDDTGAVITTEQYDAYGNRIAGTNDTPFGYQGQSGYYTDRETGLILATNRYYDPVEGRWLTRDPIGYAGGLNLYGYCSNNPVNYTDPLGLCEDGGGSWLGDLYDSWKSGELPYQIGLAPLADSWANAGYEYGRHETGHDNGKLLFEAMTGLVVDTAGYTAIIYCGGYIIYQTGALAVSSIAYIQGSRTLVGEVNGEKLYNYEEKALEGAETGCFIAGTPVATLDGYKTIENIQPGELVWSYDADSSSVITASENTKPQVKDVVQVLDKDMHVTAQAILGAVLWPGRRVYFHGRVYDVAADCGLVDTGIISSRVAQTFKRKTDALVDLTVRSSDGNDTFITGTLEHPFYVPAISDYVALGKLTPGTVLKTADGSAVTVVDSSVRYGDFDVYNFEVQGQHNYYISNDNVLVHNASKLPFEGKPGSIVETPDGAKVRQYGDDGWPKWDYDFDHSHNGVQPHYHEWLRPEDGGKPTHNLRISGGPLE
ncbi:MAG: RHS repeat-associated core domain-containing protein [Armatimonadota bacterium]